MLLVDYLGHQPRMPPLGHQETQIASPVRSTQSDTDGEARILGDSIFMEPRSVLVREDYDTSISKGPEPVDPYFQGEDRL